jgi:hypothetical protein
MPWKIGTMEYIDAVYGKVNIEEPVVWEIINSQSLQRLKGIDQAGYFLYFLSPDAESYQCFSRFDHSLGVFILLRKFGASLAEQIAGLIHDVSHGVFSHCIDYALSEGSEKEHNLQDNIFEKFVKNSEIPDILKNYNLDTDYILNDKNFPLKEKLLPDICADRIDYSLRTALFFKEIYPEMVNYFLANLMIRENFWVFKNLKSAKDFSELFLKLNQFNFSGIQSGVMFRTVGDVLKYAMEKNYITKVDLYTTDKEVLKKIENNLRDRHLKLLFDRMNNKTKFENNPMDYNAHVFCKSRIVDPYFKMSGEIKRLSEVFKEWTAIVNQESKPKEYFLKFYD